MTAGAPKKHPLLVKSPLSTKLSQWLIDWLREQPDAMCIIIEEAVIEKYQLKPPKIKK